MMKNKIHSVIAGATGFVGLDLIKILSNHPSVKIDYLCAKKNIGKSIDQFDKRIKKGLPLISKLDKVNWSNVDVLFLSLPNGEAQKFIKKIYYKYPHLKFIDLSADFRLKNYNIYKKFYKKKHHAKELINKATYSITELNKNFIKKYRIISNPGCYPTSIQLPLIPLIKRNLIVVNNIVIDSKSGFSGAGKNYKSKFKYKNFDSATYSYAPNSHRHEAEILQEFKKINKKTKFIFNPHLVPTFRGILSSIYLDKKKKVSVKSLTNILKKFYKNDHFIKINKPNTPIGTGNSLNSNICEISICQSSNPNKIIILSAIDNLVKGAAGQAVQNMNVCFKLRENMGLK